jgi:hypothetical protein
MMTLDQLKTVMKFQLTNFNDEGVTINDDTVHDEVLDDDDGFGNMNSKNLYKNAMKFTLAKKGHGIKKWPKTWMDMSVNELAPEII